MYNAFLVLVSFLKLFFVTVSIFLNTPVNLIIQVFAGHVDGRSYYR